MPPLLGIGFLVLAAVFFVVYIVFLIGQHRLQEELARHFRREGADPWHGGDASILTSPLDNYGEREKPLE